MLRTPLIGRMDLLQISLFKGLTSYDENARV